MCIGRYKAAVILKQGRGNTCPGTFGDVNENEFIVKGESACHEVST